MELVSAFTKEDLFPGRYLNFGLPVDLVKERFCQPKMQVVEQELMWKSAGRKIPPNSTELSGCESGYMMPGLLQVRQTIAPAPWNYWQHLLP